MADTLTATPEEMRKARHWIAQAIDGLVPELPFSFTYNGQSSRDFLPSADQAKWTWDLKREEIELDEGRTQHSLTYDDPHTGLQVRCEATIYTDYPAVEWIVYFQNNGDRDTPIIEDILAMDVSFTRPGPGDPTYVKRWIEWKGEAETVAVHREPGEFVVHHATGGVHSFWAFQPHDDELGPDQKLTIGGVSSQPDLPFFNLEWPDEGVIAGIGWTAPWRADFARDQERSLRVNVAMTEWVAPWQADAMRSAHLSLRPGERIRIPRILMLFWSQDRIRAQNRWRRLLFDYYSPRPDGELVKMPFGAATQWHTEEQNIAIINWHLDNGMPIEDFWMDIGWQRAPTEAEAFEHLADDVVNEKLFPNGIQAVSEAAHKRGVKYLLWFGGDERCRFQAIYPYLERVRKYRPELLSDEYPGNDNGNPMINQWMIDHYGQQIENLGIDIFRWDSRSTPPPDTDNNRRGINWARSAEGFYRFWDALLERFPSLVIDCCGGGAVNMDLETVQRSVFLHRCDYQCGGIHEPENVFNPTGMQGQTHGISSWAPLTSGCVRQLSAYAFRSAYSAGLRITFEVVVESFFTTPPMAPSEEEFDVELARKLTEEYLSIRHCFYGDYYPLCRYNLDEDAWMAWQFDRPDLGEGIVQAFRRTQSSILTCQYRLYGLEPDTQYELTNFDIPGTTVLTGGELMKDGLIIDITDQPGAVVIRYKALK